MNFCYLKLACNGNCPCGDVNRVTLDTLTQFLDTLEKHFNPSRGYFYTALPRGTHVTDDSRLQKVFDSLPVLARLQKHLVIAGQDTTVSFSHLTTPCPFCNCLNRIPQTKTSDRAGCRPGNKKYSLDVKVGPLLSRSARAAFIDPYLKLRPGDEVARFANWIKACPRLTNIAFIRGNRDPYADFTVHINGLRGLLDTARWDALHIRAFVISEASARLHARYIHTDQFTLGIEGGFQFEGCGADEMTDVYLLDSHRQVDNFYITNRNSHFQTVSAWDKPPNGGNTLQAADRNLPSFAP